jgi:uncharacterized sporulation protein YeaH/YhbH (DUF444 family)
MSNVKEDREATLYRATERKTGVPQVAAAKRTTKKKTARRPAKKKARRK